MSFILSQKMTKPCGAHAVHGSCAFAGGNAWDDQMTPPEKRVWAMLEQLDREIVIAGIIVLACIMFFLSRLIRRRGNDLRVYNDLLTKKMTAYSALTHACRIAKETGQLSAYRAVNDKAMEVLELVDDEAKDVVMDLIVMTERKSGRPDKDAFVSLVDRCMKVLNDELYSKPPKIK